MNQQQSLGKNIPCAVVDLFCGAGGLTYGFVSEHFKVIAGIDIDPACRFAYEKNNSATFIQKDVSQFTGNEIKALFGNEKFTVLAGCAPCQPFSTYTQRYKKSQADNRWKLLNEFSRIASESHPDIITMENVPTLVRHSIFDDFVNSLKQLKYNVWFGVVNSALYGVPQNRRRLVLLASKHGTIQMIKPTHPHPKTVREAISHLPPILAGNHSHKNSLHISASLSDKNLERIKISKAGGTWHDWPKHLIAICHQASSGKTYRNVYGRMEWDKPAPTITTQFYGFGNGRFGHPEQDRAISIKEAAILQSFPQKYQFTSAKEKINIHKLAQLIGNAVPPKLGQAIAKSIKTHLLSINCNIKVAH
jgi:DNA (cytosine-5)-methyltransferase 1